jgi:hypothetical protein
MSNLQNKWSLVCNPAALMNAQWQSFLPQWGVPEHLAIPLWQNRYKTGALSRFLVERFGLNIENLAHPKIAEEQLLQAEEKTFENKLTKIGTLFFYQDIIKMIDGDEIRKTKQEFGTENFNFLRQSIGKYITPPVAAFVCATKTELAFSKRNALLLGLALLLKNLPQSGDLVTFLCLKLPPLSSVPRLPEGFGLIQNKIATAYVTAHPSAQREVALEGLWREI